MGGPFPAIRLLVVVAAIALPRSVSAQDNPVVRFDTVLGSFEVELCAAPSSACTGSAPATVSNFLDNVAGGLYQDSVIHDVNPTSLTQARVIGGFYQVSGATVVTNAGLNDVISNEFNQSNLRGTLSMDKPSGQFSSHATRWFFNLVDGNAFLDGVLGGYTVFGVVLANGMDVVDAIAAQQRCDVRQQDDFDNLWGQAPLIGYGGVCNPPGGAAEPVATLVQIPDELVVVNDVSVVPEPAAGGVPVALGALLAARRVRSRGRRRACAS
jgi:cyclophilin family peptidyl-prolyl cis-trans isomerase